MIEQFEGAGASSAVFRLGDIAYRIAMVLTIIRNEDNLSAGRNLQCSDEDFNTSMGLINVFFEHSMIIYNLLPKGGNGSENPKIRQFYTLLPENEEIQRKKANEIGQSIGISERSVFNYIKQLFQMGLLKVSKYGTFQKPGKA